MTQAVAATSGGASAATERVNRPVSLDAKLQQKLDSALGADRAQDVKVVELQLA